MPNRARPADHRAQDALGNETDEEAYEPLVFDQPDLPTLPAAPLDPEPAANDTAPTENEPNPTCEPGRFCAREQRDEQSCGYLEQRASHGSKQRGGDVLVVFDRSGSMEDDWSDEPKFQAAGRALIAALTPVADHLTVGGIFFPSPESDDSEDCDDDDDDCKRAYFFGITCDVNSIRSADQLSFMPGKDFITRLPLPLNVHGGIGTPLEAGLTRADEAIRGRTSRNELVVIVLTDGKPSCGTERERILAQVAAWRTANIRTYVVGLPGAKKAAELLHEMAQAGGTDNYIEPRDPKELEQRLLAMVQPTVHAGFRSCRYELQPGTQFPEKMRLMAKYAGRGQEQEVARGQGKDASWSINAAGDQVVLEGALCQQALSGALESIRFVYGCADPPPPEPELYRGM